MTTSTPFGRWASPLRPGDVASAKVSLSQLCSDGAALYWLESRPAEEGRVVLVRAEGGRLSDHSPGGVSIRSRVHEYGGGAMCLVPQQAPGSFAYVAQDDQQVWICAGARPRALGTPAPPGRTYRHGGLSASADGDWVLAVREIHAQGRSRPERRVVALGTRAGLATESTLLTGHDFFSTPRLHPSGDRMAVVVWGHPDMPWDASSVVVTAIARVNDPVSGHDRLASAGVPWTVAGGPDESVGQPAWQRDGSLRFVSDRHGWWQPHLHPGDDRGEAPKRLTDVAAEFHGPDWVLGQSTMDEVADGTLVARMASQGRHTLVSFTGTAGRPQTIEQPCVSIAALCAHAGGLAYIGATPDTAPNVWLLPWPPAAPAPAAPRPLRPVPPGGIRPDDVARAEPFALIGRSGRPVFGALYRPTLHGTTGPAGARPPLVVWCHGGPTSSAEDGLDPGLQFFTTRGLAVATVDYAGSTGYGRAHRCALWGLWGVADAEDCQDSARYLADRGDVDGARMAIRGGSAGALTALNALAAGEGFRAAVSWYGVTDLLGLAATTHDFEAHYMDRLVGPLPGSRQLYVDRSPAAQAAAMGGSVLLLQGDEDAVVPPAQAEHMRQALNAAGVDCELRYFKGEGHGFRRADTLAACYAAELGFYRRVLGI
ncbi:MAG TPA: prolyl oligopeptidase family serine peptidase [Acidimicrobiales bacterium]|nr:prolyl oligopeptidase family serine peptidase [Acidimicrobiales bacterium]